MRLYVIRHGKPVAAWGEADEDPGLDETGRAQAEAVAERLAALPECERPVAVVSSPLRRCRETAQPLADRLGVEVRIEPAVGEIPTPAALPASARPAWLREAFGGTWSAIAGDIDYDQWRRETGRVVAGLSRTAVFSHFVAINGLVSVLRGDDRVIVFRPDHASITTLDASGGALTLVKLGAEAVTGVL
jgi:broad specificity phosphatase PhoE